MNLNEQNIERFNEELRGKGEVNDWEEFKKQIIQTAEECLFERRARRHRWWDDRCEKAMERRKKAWEKWNSDRKEESRVAFVEERNLTSKIIRGCKRNYDRTELEEIEKNFQRNNTRQFYQTFKKVIKGYQAPSLSFKDENGNLIYNNRDNCRRLAEYFKELLNCEPPKDRLEIKNIQRHDAPSNPPDEGEIRKLIQRLKSNKAAGEDQIIAEFLKITGDKVVKDLGKIMTDIWREERIPTEWKTAVIHPIFKRGDRTDVNNYRGISLLSVPYKILSLALLERIEPYVEGFLGEYQGGFRRGRSCIDQIFVLKSVLRHRVKNSKNTIVTFVDFKKAYDCIDRQSLFKILEEVGIDKKTRNIIEDTLTNTISKVKFLEEMSEAFEVGTGVRQGDGLSPLLFNCVLEKVIREWRGELVGEVQSIYLGTKNKKIEVDCLAFADDIAIIAENIEDARLQIEKLKEVAEKVGLNISWEKTEFIATKGVESRRMKTRYGTIQRREKFKYLGEWIQPNDQEKESLQNKKQRMELAYKLSRNVYNKKSISIKAKIRHYCTVVRPEVLYAVECHSLNGIGAIQKVKNVEKRILRTILGPKINEEGQYRLRPTEELYRMEGMEKIEDVMRKRRITYFGHLYRMDEGRLAKAIFGYFRGRKNKNQWMERTIRDMEEAGIVELMMSDRGRCREAVRMFGGFRDAVRRGVVYSEERREAARVRMKRYWDDVRSGVRLRKGKPK